MKDLITDANFPKTADGAVYHLGLKAGDLASRIITVGDPARARGIAKLFDPPTSSKSDENGREERANLTPEPGPGPEPAFFALQSERGFLTLTGKYKGIPVSIVAIGMGAPNMDFFVRECREVLDDSGERDMLIIRFGSCGGLVSELPVGSLTLPKAAIAVNRNYDFDFVNTDDSGSGSVDAYRISQPTNTDPLLHQLLLETLRETLPSTIVKDDFMNASADSFYSSQGRVTSFPDHNGGLIDKLVEMGVGSLEMETFHLLHLANSWPRRRQSQNLSEAIEGSESVPPPTNMPAELHLLSHSDITHTSIDPGEVTTSKSSVNGAVTKREDKEEYINAKGKEKGDGPRIRAAAVQMIFAERSSRAFISPEEVDTLQNVAARGLMETLIKWK